MTQFQASTKAAEAPDIEAGMYDALFDLMDGRIVERPKYDDRGNFIPASVAEKATASSS